MGMNVEKLQQTEKARTFDKILQMEKRVDKIF